MIPGLIIVEGSDAVGKTTLIRNAMASWAPNSKYLHCTRKSSPALIERHLLRMFALAIRYVLAGKTVFMDRWWPSDAVYAPAFGRPTGNLGAYQLMDDTLRHLRIGGYVFCYDADPMVTVERHAKMSRIRPEMYSNIKDVASHYSDFALGRRPIAHVYACQDRLIRPIEPFADPKCDEKFRNLCGKLLFPIAGWREMLNAAFLPNNILLGGSK